MTPRGAWGVCHTAAAAAALLIPISILFAQSAKRPSRQKVLRHDAQAVIKLISVRVLGRDGRPLPGLDRDDFVLYDNGVRQSISEFEVHALSEKGMTVRSGGRPAADVEIRPGMNRRLFLFLDLQGSDVVGMANAKKAALHFVDHQLRSGDEVGVLMFSPMRGFVIQEYLTTDHGKIRRALIKAREIPPSEGRMEKSASGEDIWIPGTSIFQRRDFANRMADLALAMQHVSGNKSLILFTGRRLGLIASKLGKAFAAAGIPVYPVNTQNWIVHRIMKLSVKKHHIWKNHPLQDLAALSGGRYFADIKDVEAICRDVQMLTGQFYVLGYYVNENWDGRYHQIKVSVNRSGATILAQDGFFSQKPYSERSDFEKQLELWDLINTRSPGSMGLAEIPMEPLLASFGKKTACIFISRLTVDPKTGAPPAEVEVTALLRDQDRRHVYSKQSRIDFSDFNQRVLYPYFTAELEPGLYESRILVRDTITGRAAVGISSVTVPPNADSDIQLASPLLFLEGRESTFVRMRDHKDRGKKKRDSLIDHYRYLPRNRRLILKELESGSRTIRAVLPVRYRKGTPLAVDLTVRIQSRAGDEPVDLNTRIVETMRGRPGIEFFILDFDLPVLERGEYELEILAAAVDSGARFSIKKLLVIF